MAIVIVGSMSILSPAFNIRNTKAITCPHCYLTYKWLQFAAQFKANLPAEPDQSDGTSMSLSIGEEHDVGPDAYPWLCNYTDFVHASEPEPLRST